MHTWARKCPRAAPKPKKGAASKGSTSARVSSVSREQWEQEQGAGAKGAQARERAAQAGSSGSRSREQGAGAKGAQVQGAGSTSVRSGEHECREQECGEQGVGAGRSAMCACNRGLYYVSSCALSSRASSTAHDRAANSLVAVRV